MMWTLLSPRLWIALVLSAGLIGSHYQAYRSGKQTIQREWTAFNTQQELETQRLALAAAEKERQLNRKVNTVAQNYENAKKINSTLATSLGDRVREFTAELDKRDAADTATATVDHGATPERIVLRDCANNLQALAGISQQHKEQIVALQAYITSVQNLVTSK